MEIMYPVGRFIGGSLKELHDRKNDDGSPKLDSNGKPAKVCNLGVAIPKTQSDWRNEPWGRVMFDIGKAAEPLLHQAAAFAWKVIDGDGTLPNKNGKIPVQQEGYAGCWVLWFSQGWLPKQCNADGTVELPPGSIMPGQYVQVAADVSPNGAKPPQTPGLYLNLRAVALAADGDRIVSNDVDTTKLGFGKGAPLPPGARPVQPAVPGFGGQAASAPAPALQVTVTPNAAFMQPPVPPVTPPAPAIPPAPVMTPKAGGATYEQFKAQGWSDAQMRAEGYLA